MITFKSRPILMVRMATNTEASCIEMAMLLGFNSRERCGNHHEGKNGAVPIKLGPCLTVTTLILPQKRRRNFWRTLYSCHSQRHIRSGFWIVGECAQLWEDYQTAHYIRRGELAGRISEGPNAKERERIEAQYMRTDCYPRAHESRL